jgi:hypothetical protein
MKKAIIFIILQFVIIIAFADEYNIKSYMELTYNNYPENNNFWWTFNCAIYSLIDNDIELLGWYF